METKISVLVAEPSEEYRAAYARAIARETDMELVAQTDNGLRAEALVDEFQPDVVVLDLVLASVDGMSLLARLQAKEKPPRVIVTSAIYNDEVLMECADLGTMYFMQKPVDPPLLVYRIRQTARPRRRTGSLCAQLDAPEPAPRSRASSPMSSMRSASRRTSRATSTCARRSCWPSTTWTSSIP